MAAATTPAARVAGKGKNGKGKHENKAKGANALKVMSLVNVAYEIRKERVMSLRYMNVESCLV